MQTNYHWTNFYNMIIGLIFIMSAISLFFWKLIKLVQNFPLRSIAPNHNNSHIQKTMFFFSFPFMHSRRILNINPIQLNQYLIQAPKSKQAKLEIAFNVGQHREALPQSLMHNNSRKNGNGKHEIVGCNIELFKHERIAKWLRHSTLIHLFKFWALVSTSPPMCVGVYPCVYTLFSPRLRWVLIPC